VNQKIIICILVVLALIGGSVLFSGNSKEEETVKTNMGTLKEKSSMKNEVDTMTASDSYVAYSAEKVAMQKNADNVVLFFRASWCPTCRALDADIKANNIPESLTILDVDYDNSSELKRKYGVTYQHTLVQVDKDGNLIKKWSGSPTLLSLVSEIKK